ncbi:GIY-YIG nuclease family protein [Halodesulfurarchaeum formicicum]|uniref:GIY-YIG nuclease family protein n=1 Tax=Halodesulfurarchaeum formicicum TaxID=1873524 RepID=UPI000903F80E|nr:GIY-YIG nuclease family protein [Halodesulfurarchaeum formicicum]
MHYVYLLHCGDGSLYTGYTTDVRRRVAEHRAGEGAKYTRGRGPLTLRRVEAYRSRSAAQSREYEIKQLSRPAKTRLVPDLDDRIALGGLFVGEAVQ